MVNHEHAPAGRHEVPTHLGVEDKAFWGLSVRQALTLAGGLSGGYSVWTEWADLPDPLRFGLAAACLVTAAVLALVRPAGRGLEEWAFVALHYAAAPKACVWRRPEPVRRDWQPRHEAWAQLAPSVGWQPGEEAEA